MRNEKDLKCVLCGMEAEYVRDGMSLCEKHFKAQQIGEKEIDLVKIQIYTDECHAILSAWISFALVVFSLIVIFYPLYVQATLEGKPYSISGLVGLVGTLGMVLFACIYLYKSSQKYNRNLGKISRMINAVQKGKHLPDLDKLNEWEKEDGDKIG
jgi:hypothetical protein